MTIDEAIKRLQTILSKEPDACWLDEYNALKLGIEALKRVAKRNFITHTELTSPLPGETEK